MIRLPFNYLEFLLIHFTLDLSNILMAITGIAEEQEAAHAMVL